MIRMVFEINQAETLIALLRKEISEIEDARMYGDDSVGTLGSKIFSLEQIRDRIETAMKPLTDEQIIEWEQVIRREHDFLLNHGWKLVSVDQKECWESPSGKIYLYQDGYSQLTMILLKERGWRYFTEIRHMGWDKSSVTKTHRYARYRSPATGKIFSFLDAQKVMENDWNEDVPCCKSTEKLNEIAPKDFTGNELNTHHYWDTESRRFVVTLFNE